MRTSALAIGVTPVNDAPTATFAVANYAAVEQTTLVLHGTGPSIADVDAGNATISAQMMVGQGALNVWAGGNAVAVAGSGTGAGGLLAAMLTSMPAWRALDPLVLLAPSGERARHWDQPDNTEMSDEEAAVVDVLGDAKVAARRTE